MGRTSDREHFEGGGKYSSENKAMLAQEQLRLGEWKGESTSYRPARVTLLMTVTGILLLVAAGAALYYFAFPGSR